MGYGVSHQNVDVPSADDPHRLLDGRRGGRPAGYTPGEPVVGEIAVYFADDQRSLYQLRQWLPVFELLDRRHPVVIVTGHAESYAALGRLTGLRTVFAPTWPDLAGLYETSAFRMAIYVNNSMYNFSR